MLFRKIKGKLGEMAHLLNSVKTFTEGLPDTRTRDYQYRVNTDIRQGNKPSIVDLNFIDPRLSRDRYTVSEHQALAYLLQPMSRTAEITRMPRRVRRTLAIFDREIFPCSLEGA